MDMEIVTSFPFGIHREIGSNALRSRTEDTMYLVKVSKRLSIAMEEYEGDESEDERNRH